MTRVQAHADARVAVHRVDDRRELAEAGAERGALARRLFEQHHRAATAPRAEQFEQCVGNQREAAGGIAGCIAAGMQHHAEQAERLGAIELVAHRLERLAAERGVAGGEIDQIAAVRHHWRDARRLDASAELADFLRRQRPAAPLAGILREDLQRLAAMDDGALDRPRQTAGDRHVGP